MVGWNGLRESQFKRTPQLRRYQLCFIIVLQDIYNCIVLQDIYNRNLSFLDWYGKYEFLIPVMRL